MVIGLDIKRSWILLIFGLIILGMIGGPVLASEPSGWAAEEIEKAIELEATTEFLMSDYQGTLTRDAFVELLVKTYEAVTDEVMDVSSVKNPFTDTDQLYVIKAYASGIAKGTSSTTFSPHAEVTREQMVVMFVRMAEAVEAKRAIKILDSAIDVEPFEDDVFISDWAKESIYKALANGILTGGQGTTFQAQDDSTSEQALVINYRMLMKIVQTGKITIMWQYNLLDYEEAVRVVAERALETYVESDRKAFVLADVLNMRSTPDTSDNDNVIRRLQAYEELVILSDEDGWHKVAASGDVVGYVHGDYIHEYSPDEDLGDIRMQIVAYAKQFIGTPYRYAGNSLEGGIDCSGFTKQVVRPFGYVLDRSSSGQGDDGIAIAESELKAGDLVVYGYSGNISHVALYIGNGEIIHATTSSGVKVTDMLGYLYKPVIGYRRVVF